MQIILVYMDGDQYCARWGQPMPHQLAIGFGESPVAALIELLMDVENAKDGLGLNVDFSTLNYQYNEEEDGKISWGILNGLLGGAGNGEPSNALPVGE